MGSGVRGVLFDIDDTLFDRRRAQYLALQAIMQALPHLFAGTECAQVERAFAESDRIAFEEFTSGAGAGDVRARRSQSFLALLGLDQAFAQQVTDLYVTRYPEVDASAPGARYVVQGLAASYRVGVVSNGWPDVQYRKLETLGIRDDLHCIVLSEEIGIRKPAPGIFLHAAALLGLRPEACIHVGDSYETDVLGAQGAHMRACWFNPQREHPPAGAQPADLEIGELRELILGIQAINCPACP